MIGNMKTTALASLRGSIDFMCPHASTRRPFLQACSSRRGAALFPSISAAYQLDRNLDRVHIPWT
ncbi:hypothetical protein PQR75_12025 [Paraburkholderia fungorum]|jgi:hypothetical protein|uniref:hypothetical protein n=1 Tax=Paraburkholderia fungorum TaxID=134537 RepID=UPI0038B6EE06